MGLGRWNNDLHFKIILRQLAFREMSQGVLARVVDSPLTWTFSGNNIEQIEPFFPFA